MSESTDALRLADRLLDEPNCDPDDDIRVLARQLIRRAEKIERLEKLLAEQHDPTRDMIEANRDSMLRIADDALRKVGKLLDKGINAIDWVSIGLARDVVKAQNVFHPMHGESWPGWPKGTENL